MEEGGRCVVTPASLEQDPSKHDRAIDIILEYLPRTPVTEFALAGFQVAEAVYVSVAEAVSASGQLIAFSMAACSDPSGGPGATDEVMSRLGKCTHLQRMGVIECGLGDGALATLCSKSVLHPGASLRRLVLAANAFGAEGMSAFVEAVCQGGSDGLVRLADLDVSNNALGDAGAEALGTLLAEGTPIRLEALQAEQCGFGAGGFESLLRSVSKSSRLRFLDVSGNDAGDAGAAAVAALIRHATPHLEEVRLTRCSVPDAGLAEIFKATAGHPGIKLLDTSGSPIASPRALAACCDMVKANATLKGLKLELSSAADAAEISAAVKINPSLVDIELSGPRNDAALSSIRMQLSANRRYASGTEHRPYGGEGPLASPPRKGGPGRSLSGAQGGTPGGRVRPQASPSLAAYSGLSKSASMVSRGESLRPETRSRVRRRDSVLDDDGADGRSVAASGAGSGAVAPVGAVLGRGDKPTLVGGGAAHIAAQVFNDVDEGVKGYLDGRDMLRALLLLGVLDGYTKREMEAIARNELRVADLSGTGRVCLDDFRRYYNQLLHSRAKELRREKLDEAKAVTYPPGYRKHEELRAVFQDFAAFGAGHGRQRIAHADVLDSGQWSKLCRDAKFVAPWGPLPGGSVEIIFARAKRTRETKGLSYRAFLRALAMVAQETAAPFEEVLEALGVEPLPVHEAWAGAASPDNASVVSGMSAASGASLTSQGLDKRLSTMRQVSVRMGLGHHADGQGGGTSDVGSTLLRKRASLGGGAFFKGYYAHDRSVNTVAAVEAHAEMAEAGGGVDRGTVDNFLAGVAVEGTAEEVDHGQGQGQGRAGSRVGSVVSRSRGGSVVSASQARALSRPAGRRDGTPASQPRSRAGSVAGRSRASSVVAGQPSAAKSERPAGGAGPVPPRNLAASMGEPARQPASADAALVRRLEARVAYLEGRVKALEAAGAPGAPGAPAPGEDRMARFETAILQIASKVDELENSHKAEQQDTLKALEAILSASKALTKPSPLGNK